ncbi:MAG TPA: c-type cytochrome, partial [Thermoanaerobaculia bacterium]|nr:c-type cytochrome [Thermoanaerobaculia bacterium]
MLIASVTVVTGDTYQTSPVNRPWPPGVQKVSNESPVLPPDEAVKTFFMPPGYRVELVASEPLIHDPTAIDWDLEGRLWVVEMTGFVRDLVTPEPNLDPIGNVVVLEDTDNDGKMDRRTVFADKLILPRAVKVLDSGVLVGEPGTLWFMRDTNGDLKADSREVITHSYGLLRGSVEGNANSLLWGLDNVMHTSENEVNIRLKNGEFELKPTLSRGEWGLSQDDAGRMYRNTNESALHADLVPTPYFQRNPALLRTRGSYESLAGENGDLNVVWPVRPNPGTNRAYQAGIDREDGSLNRFTAVCAPLIYRGDRLPADLYGNAFVAEPAANFVSRIVLSDDGTTIRARKAYENAEFLASTDERFRPVYITNAPDGALYVVDMYRGVIQDRMSTTIYLRDHILSRKLDAPVGLGRIYRVVHETTKRDTMNPFASAPPAQLVEALSHPNGWRRDTAQRLLVERNAKSVVPALVRLAENANDPRTKLHALWTLDGLDAIEPATVTKALADPAADVRTSAIRIAERWLGTPNQPVAAAVLDLTGDPHWSVREQLAASLGILPPGPREAAAAAMLERHASDPVVVDATLSGLRGSESVVLEKLLQGGAQTPQREIAITMLAATIVRAGQDAAIHSLLASIGDAGGIDWQRSALMRGAEVAVLNAPMPGAAARRAAPPIPSAPCPTCPGGRAGPGGAYAFPRGSAPTAAGRGGQRIVRLSREPAEFSAAAAAGGDLGTRAANVLSRIEWPGKPGVAAPLPVLTAEEQKRFDDGREVYRNICQACHQPDGRGQERLAPSLVGSALALAAAQIPARILLNGKEGPIGLMPPVGSVLSDGQIAGVLTYIRREWGQTGTPVDAAEVARVRAQTVSRTRPWTH